MIFHDRADELNALGTAFDSPGYSFFVIYGRRRAGKTELIKAFCSERPHIYFLAAQGTEERQQEKFVARVVDYFCDRVPHIDEFHRGGEASELAAETSPETAPSPDLWKFLSEEEKRAYVEEVERRHGH